jgi:hypothetical protein
MSQRSVLRHQAVYRRIVALTPQRHRVRHGESQVRLFGDMLLAGEAPLKLWVGVVPDLLRVMGSYRNELSCHLARVGVGVVGLASIGAGVVIGSTWLDEYGDVPALFPAAAAALVLQGSFGVIWLSTRVDRWRSLADRLFLAGEVVAFGIGGVVVAMAITTRSPTNPEALRLLVGSVAAGHATLGLTAFRLTRRRVADPDQ